ncbi:hypothetical protein AB0D97_32415 [Streptomyces roseus]|uniref:hypothetical protein n=1 Tax=Streptomyces roseus TaxID=66430 RepID=UPI0033EA2DFB
MSGLRVAGILAEAKRTVRISGGGTPGRLDVSVTSGTRSIAFSASASQVTHTRVYLKGSL